jgi:nucleoside-diphosphate-sugar epimerase
MADESLAHSDSWLSPWDEMLSVSEGIVCALTAGIEGIALRPAFVWGDEDDESLPRFRALAEKKALVLPGGGDQSFCSTHADNLAFAFLCAADAPTELAGNAYWVTDDERITAKRFLTRWLVSAGARGPRSGLLPFRAARALAWIDERSGGMSRAELALVGVALSVDSKRVRNELGYEPKVTVDEGMKRLATSAHRAGESQRSERATDAAAG